MFSQVPNFCVYSEIWHFVVYFSIILTLLSLTFSVISVSELLFGIFQFNFHENLSLKNTTIMEIYDQEVTDDNDDDRMLLCLIMSLHFHSSCHVSCPYVFMSYSFMSRSFFIQIWCTKTQQVYTL